ncbi:ABC transporter permease [Desulfolutivibrio sulfoxidireducens]|uniref:ABC transporter permease n=1 Tax=Desulfolutivibrio sulfoxidireducens TaxID=2773299 RepID=UPI00159DB5B0|nr:iron ABC transporter permease [Desulfolutivibrio sulfoxidireducens]QLA20297.1 ABC transporter permease subunit [Desulfolutivibrio sulfoxidireducens]
MAGTVRQINTPPTPDGAAGRAAPFFLSPLGLCYGLILASVLVFVLWPIAAVFLQSVVIDGRPSLAEYVHLFTRETGLLLNSVSVSALTTVLSVGLATCVALYLTHTRLPGKRLVFGVLMLSIIAPPFVSSLVYIMLFGRRGLVTHQLLGLNIDPYGWQGVVLMQTAGFTAMAALLILGVLHRVDRRLEHAAHDLGASSPRVLVGVTLPLAAPGLLVAAIMVFIRALSDFGTPIIIGGRFTALATQAYLNVVGLFNMPRAAAMSIMLLLPALAAFLVYRRVLGRTNVLGAAPALERARDRIGLSPVARWILALCTWGFIGFELVKYATILCGAFTRTWGVDFTPTLGHLQALTADRLGSFFRSLHYSVAAGAAGAVLGGVIAYVLARKRPPGGRALDFIVDLPYIIPGPFFGIAYILAFHNPPLALTGTAFIVVANCVYRQLPIGIKAGMAALAQCRPEIEAGARDLGARERHVIVDIVAPLMKPALLVAFINTFTSTMITIGAIIFLISPDTKVLTVDMFAEIKRGRIGEAAVLANVIIVSVLAVNLFFSWLYLRKRKT